MTYEDVTGYLKEHKLLSIPALQAQFSADYYSVLLIVNKLLEEEYICLKEGIVYGLTEAGEKKFLPRPGPNFKPDGNDYGDDDDDDPFQSIFQRRRRYLEERRQEVVRKMMHKTDEEEGLHPVLLAAWRTFREYGSAVREENAIYLTFTEDVTLAGTPVRLKLYEKEGDVYLSDNGVTMRSVRDEELETGPAEDRAGRIEDIMLQDGELCLKVKDLDDAVACLMQLYAAMREVFSVACGGRDLDEFPELFDDDDDDDDDDESDDSGDGSDVSDDSDDSDDSGDDPEEKPDDLPMVPGAISVSIAKPDPVDPEYLRALKFTIETGKVSICALQRSLGMGYMRAGQIIEWMEAMGFISEPQGSKRKRTVILTMEEFLAKFGQTD